MKIPKHLSQVNRLSKVIRVAAPKLMAIIVERQLTGGRIIREAKVEIANFEKLVIFVKVASFLTDSVTHPEVLPG